MEYIQINCNGKEGTYGAIDMIQKLHVDVIVGPGCGAGKLYYPLSANTFELTNLTPQKLIE